MMTPATRTLDLQDLRTYVSEQCGILLTPDKSKVMEAQIEQLMQEYGCEDGEEFYRLIESHRRPEVRDRIMEVLTSRETQWFRDAHPFEALRQVILPAIVDGPSSDPSQPVRIWSAGCSTGQEPYSIAMFVDRFCQEHNHVEPDRFEIVGTDISPSALMLAMAGRYNRVAMEQGLADDIRREYFEQQARTWEVKPGIRAAVRFRKANLQDNLADLGTFDVIFMRYVESDYSKAFREALYRNLARALSSPGYLILGEGESPVETGPQFEALSHAGARYYRFTV